MKGISTVGILILTVFLSMSVLPAACVNVPPCSYPVSGYVYYPDGTSADGAKVTIYMEETESNCITTTVGSSGISAFFKADASNVGVTPDDEGEILIVKIADERSNIGSDRLTVTAPRDAANHQFDDIIITPKAPPGGSPGGGGGDGTYPPGWGETPTPAPTPDATATPASTEITEPSVTTPSEEKTVTTAAEGEATAEGTEPTTELKTPGFGAVFMIAGLLAVAYLVLRRRE